MLPKFIPQDRIEELKKKADIDQDARLDVGPTESRSVVQQRINAAQDDFLSVLSQSLSVKLALERTGVSRNQYAEWRKNDYRFCERLNEILTDWREELMGSAVSRAIGYTAADSNGNLITDASGKVRYFDGSDSLARALLQMDSEGNKKDNGLNLSINIDSMAVGFDNPEQVKSVAESFARANSNVTIDGVAVRIPNDETETETQD